MTDNAETGASILSQPPEEFIESVKNALLNAGERCRMSTFRAIACADLLDEIIPAVRRACRAKDSDAVVSMSVTSTGIKHIVMTVMISDHPFVSLHMHLDDQKLTYASAGPSMCYTSYISAQPEWQDSMAEKTPEAEEAAARVAKLTVLRAMTQRKSGLLFEALTDVTSPRGMQQEPSYYDQA